MTTLTITAVVATMAALAAAAAAAAAGLGCGGEVGGGVKQGNDQDRTACRLVQPGQEYRAEADPYCPADRAAPGRSPGSLRQPRTAGDARVPRSATRSGWCGSFVDRLLRRTSRGSAALDLLTEAVHHEDGRRGRPGVPTPEHPSKERSHRRGAPSR